MSGMNRATYFLQKYPKIMVIGTRLGWLWMNIRNGASHTNLCGDGYFCNFVKYRGQIWSFPFRLNAHARSPPLQPSRSCEASCDITKKRVSRLLLDLG